MKIGHSATLPAILVAATLLGGQVAYAEEFRLVSGDNASTCQTGTKSDSMVVEGRDDVLIGQADGDTLNTAICVSDESRSVVHVQWQASGYWKSSGDVAGGCAEILGASKIKVRAVDSNFRESATYYTCAKE